MATDKRGSKKYKGASGATANRRGSTERNRIGGGHAQKGRFHARAERTATEQRQIQQRGEKLREKRADETRKKNGRATEHNSSSAVQTGPRVQPAPPLPAQHQQKPGIESKLRPRPRYLAPSYVGSGKLQGMTALITGGDSGIGRAVAVLFAREGADVIIVYLNEHSDAEETKEAVENEGGECLLLSGDVTDQSFCRAAVATAVRTFGKLDVLVNNAAFQMNQESLEDITVEQFDRTVKTNLYGYFFMAQAALPHLKNGSSIINTGSVVGRFGHKSLIDYAMTKGAIDNFTKSLAQNLAEKGIRVNGVAPGPIWTPLNPADRSAEDIQEFGSSVLMKRPGQPEEVSPAFVFLAAPSCASYITGEIIGVLGGETGSG